MKSTFLFLGAINALLGVSMGAFGAHGLKSILSPEMMSVYQTGVTYQMWHALGLVGIALLRLQHAASKLLAWAGWLMVIGIVLFSGSLYLLAMTQFLRLGMITPFGGLSFLAAWLLLGVYSLQKPQRGH